MFGQGLRAVVGSTTLLFVLASSSSAQCSEWDHIFGPGGMNGQVHAFTVFDDGHGPTLYAGGYFTTAGSVAAFNLARWNGSRWSPVGIGVDGVVEAMLVFNDGTGPALYVAGDFLNAGGTQANRIAKWNGSSWSALGLGLNASALALAVFDDGNGPALFVGGGFAFAGGASAVGIAKWDGSGWSSLGSGVDNGVQALAVFDPGTGLQLYAGGSFAHAGGAPADNIASWNGTVWSPVGSGVNASLRALAVYDSGTGPALYAGGDMNMAGAVQVNHLGRWNGTSWSSAGGGTDNIVAALTVLDDGAGLRLYAGGFFTSAGGHPASRVASWNGTAWSALGSGMDQFVLALGSYNESGQVKLFAGGEFSFAGGIQANRVARWDGSTWAGADAGSNQGMDQLVDAFEVFDDGAGPALYAGGGFTHAGGVAADHIARWAGAGWSPLAGGIDGGSLPYVNTMKAFHDSGGNPSLYVGGDFTTAGGGPASCIARWDGVTWWPLGSGTNLVVEAMEVFDDGGGPALYVGGVFTLAGGLPANRIAKWDGQGWSPLGAGMDAGVDALAVFDDGTGPALFAGGSFSTAGGIAAGRIAKWNGANWSAVGSGVGNAVSSLQVYDSGNGPGLFVAGGFLTAGGISVNNIARWDGSNWSALGEGLSGFSSLVRDLHVFDEGSGLSLYATGSFTIAGGAPAARIARWNGVNWFPLGRGITAPGNPGHHPFALGSIDDGSGQGADLYVGGAFTIAGGSPASAVARWRGCASPVQPFCAGDGKSSPCPCGNNGLPLHGCDNSSGTGGGILSSTGSTRTDTVVLHASGERSEALSIFLQGDVLLTPGASFGDGLRCASGNLKRLYVHTALQGSVSAPGPGEASILVRSASLGDPIATGSVRFYQIWYRDPVEGFCPPPFGGNWNVTNGLRITW